MAKKIETVIDELILILNGEKKTEWVPVSSKVQRDEWVYEIIGGK